MKLGGPRGKCAGQDRTNNAYNLCRQYYNAALRGFISGGLVLYVFCVSGNLA